ncbi:hypothetical protein [Natrinema soli]|uniref:Uncharacterized protein n=1 Tax=Natrinema soli TaxID=1930624 RepID=A0ABD5SMG9_9EURY|nr:hypothetical protein [Natrinema soli]
MDEKLVERVLTEEDDNRTVTKKVSDKLARFSLAAVAELIFDVYYRNFRQMVENPFEVGCMCLAVGYLVALVSYPLAWLAGSNALSFWHVLSPAGSSFGEKEIVTELVGSDGYILLSLLLDGSLWLLPGLVHIVGLLLSLVGAVLLVLWAAFRR